MRTIEGHGRALMRLGYIIIVQYDITVVSQWKLIKLKWYFKNIIYIPQPKRQCI